MKLIITIKHDRFCLRKARKDILIVSSCICDGEMLEFKAKLVGKHDGIIKLRVFSLLISEHSNVMTLVCLFSYDSVTQQARKQRIFIKREKVGVSWRVF